MASHRHAATLKRCGRIVHEVFIVFTDLDNHLPYEVNDKEQNISDCCLTVTKGATTFY
jgi:hypothetical protein